MNIKEKLEKYFNDRGFQRVDLHRSDMELFYIGRNSSVSLVWVLTDEALSLKKEEYLSYADRIRRTFSEKQYEHINLLSLFLTNNAAAALSFGREIPFWVVDESYGRVVIYEDMPEDYEGLKLPIENMVRLFSDPGVNAYGRTHPDEYETFGMNEDPADGEKTGSGYSANGRNAQGLNRMGSTNLRRALRSRKPYVVYALVVINIIVFFLTDLLGDTFGTKDWLVSGSISWMKLFGDGEYYRLFTCMFLHADIGHVSGNLIGLYALGEMLEDELGHVRFTILYILGGVAAAAASSYYYKLNNEYISSIGASGAIFALVGAMAMMLFMYRDRLRKISRSNVLFFIIYLLLSFFGGGNGVDVAAHVCGFIAGGLICIILCMLQEKSRKAGER